MSQISPMALKSWSNVLARILRRCALSLENAISKPRMLVAVALANKMARMIWAMLTNKEDYRLPVTASA